MGTSDLARNFLKALIRWFAGTKFFELMILWVVESEVAYDAAVVACRTALGVAEEEASAQAPSYARSS